MQKVRLTPAEEKTFTDSIADINGFNAQQKSLEAKLAEVKSNGQKALRTFKNVRDMIIEKNKIDIKQVDENGVFQIKDGFLILPEKKASERIKREIKKTPTKKTGK